MLKTNSPNVRYAVPYARVMGERVSMNREGLMAHTREYVTVKGKTTVYPTPRTDVVPMKYVSMARPDIRLIVVPLSRPRTAARKAALTKPHAHPGGVVCHNSTVRKPCQLWNAR
jgi:hypothetical protein